MTSLERHSHCKVNLLLNILGKRPDGFHELETVMHPVGLCDTLSFQRAAGQGIELTCSNPTLPTDSGNLVFKAAASFLESARAKDHVRIHLEKRIPLAAGLGGGSGNAAATLLALNELFGHPLSPKTLGSLAASLGSDVPFFLQDLPALGTGRGEVITPLGFFPALRGTSILLIHPGFGVATAWAYKALAAFPNALNGDHTRAQRLIQLLQIGTLTEASRSFYNSLEAPVLSKYPVLQLYQEFLREHGAQATLMSGSGSTTFALTESESSAQDLAVQFKRNFGDRLWTAIVPFGQ